MEGYSQEHKNIQGDAEVDVKTELGDRPSSTNYQSLKKSFV